MSGQTPLCAQSAGLKNAVVWMSAAISEQPDKKRSTIIQEAQLRFDLTPRECQFLQDHFQHDASASPSSCG